MKFIIIGGGPGGYVAAIRAAQLGAKVTLIEKENLGGVCLNKGCIPTKTLLNSVKILLQVKKSQEYGIKGEVFLDWGILQKKKDNVIKQLQEGVGYLLKANNVEVIKGEGKLVTENKVEVSSNSSKKIISGDKVIIATGSRPIIPPIPGIENPNVLDSTKALNLNKVPAKMVVLGGGVIGVEMATLFAGLGCEVTIVEMLPKILPREDKDVSESLAESLKKMGIKIKTNCKLLKIDTQGEGLLLTLEKGEKIKTEKLLVAVGRRANIEGLGLEKLDVKLQKGFIVVNEQLFSSNKNILAIGDCTGKVQLAHVASEQGIVAVEAAMGKKVKMDYSVIPSNIFTIPEAAGVGLTEEEARIKYGNVLTAKFPFAAGGKALADNSTEGFIKVIAEPRYKEILGVHIFGERATDLVAEAVLAIKLEATLEDIAETIHGHPTFNEMLKEAVLLTEKKAIHLPPY